MSHHRKLSAGSSASRRDFSRRDFLRRSAAAGVTAAVGLSIARSAHAAGDEVLRVGLVGCGGRGTGAARDALVADKNTRLVALSDAFADRMQSCLKGLQKNEAIADRVKVTPETCFAGFDGYKQLIASGVDVVLLATPPHFRPMHLKACVEAGKHVFCEKPMAVDAPGVRSILESAELARQKKLSLVSGFCWRYHSGVRETIQRVLDGAIGDILAIQETYNTGTLWQRPRQPDWTEMEFQMRNWYYFTWLSGDHNVEQHVHSLDKALWAMRDQPPARAWGLGGRQVRTAPQFGNIYDHHAVVYEYPNGTRVYSFCRQMANCYNEVSDIFHGTKGRADILKHTIEGQTSWKYSGPPCDMYRAEHEVLFRSIREGRGHNDGVWMAYSTMMAILGRMVTYTGQMLTWEQALNSQEKLSPERYAFDAQPPIVPQADGNYPVAMPGLTKFV